MNPSDAAHWKSAVLDEIFAALAASEQLDECLVFKGARVLNARLRGGRQSLDLDSNLAASFVEKYPDREKQQAFLEEQVTKAIRRHFERQDPVRYELTALTIRTWPPKSHPMRWDAFKVRINVNDLTRSVKSLPALEIDVATPEELLDTSVSLIDVGGHQVHAYTLERIGGEKLRAFLSSLPAYRKKVKKPGEAVRVKDLYDVARVRRAHALDQVEFWTTVGKEFQVACQSRFIDCLGLATFQEQWEVTRKIYEATMPKDIPFAEIEAILPAIVRFLEAERILPFAFSMSEGKSE
jgi:hypothetical protein